MKKVIYQKAGKIDRETGSFPMLLHRSRERNKILKIANSPVEVTDSEYQALKNGKYGDDIILVEDRGGLPAPIKIGAKNKTSKVKVKEARTHSANPMIEKKK